MFVYGDTLYGQRPAVDRRLAKTVRHAATIFGGPAFAFVGTPVPSVGAAAAQGDVAASYGEADVGEGRAVGLAWRGLRRP